MTWDIAITLLVMIGAVVLFVTEKLRVDVVGMLALVTLLVTGVLAPDAALRGFSNPATVTVAAMFVLSAALLRTGAGEIAGRAMSRMADKGLGLGLLVLMVSVGVASAFINNTAAVAILLPVVLGVATKIGVSPSKLLMPLSFASMFGGVCTLIGTSTNLLASEIARQHGAAPFRMFEFAPLGLVFFAVGTIYMLTFGARLIPDRRPPEDLTTNFEMDDYLIEVVVEEGSALVGSRLSDLDRLRELEVEVLEIRRGEERRTLPPSEAVLRVGDVLRIRSHLRAIKTLRSEAGVDFAPAVQWRDAELEAADIVLVELVIPAGSGLIGRTLEQARFRNTFGATVLAIRHRGEILHQRLKRIRLGAGDTLLVEARRNRLSQLRASRDVIFVSESQLGGLRTQKLLPAAVILTAVVLSASSGLVPIVVSSLVGAMAMVLSRCITIEEAYDAVDWKIIFLLAGVLGLGTALEQSGGAAMLSRHVVDAFAWLGPVAVLSGFYLLTSLLTEAMSNNATVVLLAPVAIVTAEALGVDSRPFLMAVTFAASASFMTPVGYQTNTLIYGPGRYRFSDFIRVGLPLNVLFWILATLLIPRIWPF
ncbi:MAG: anion permease [Holophagales bacterium]|nr:anion permease [Holophagales bacterium]